MFVPDTVRSSVLEWTHSSRLACQPDSRRTLAFVLHRFCLPTMVLDVSAFIAACKACAQNTAPRQAKADLLQPLPGLTYTWTLSQVFPCLPLTVVFLVLEGTLHAHWVVGQLVLWVPPSVQWPVGASQSRPGNDSSLPCLHQPHHLEPATCVG